MKYNQYIGSCGNILWSRNIRASMMLIKIVFLLFCTPGIMTKAPVGPLILNECSYLERQPNQEHNAYKLSGLQICCMCPKGTYLAEDCSHEHPSSTICRPCEHNSKVQTYTDFEPHDRKECYTDSTSCMSPFIKVGGSRSEKSKCECPPGTRKLNAYECSKLPKEIPKPNEEFNKKVDEERKDGNGSVVIPPLSPPGVTEDNDTDPGKKKNITTTKKPQTVTPDIQRNEIDFTEPGKPNEEEQLPSRRTNGIGVNNKTGTAGDSTTTDPPPTSSMDQTTDPNNSQKSGLGEGQIIGIIVGMVVVGLAILGLFVGVRFFIKNKKGSSGCYGQSEPLKAVFKDVILSRQRSMSASPVPEPQDTRPTDDVDSGMNHPYPSDECDLFLPPDTNGSELRTTEESKTEEQNHENEQKYEEMTFQEPQSLNENKAEPIYDDAMRPTVTRTEPQPNQSVSQSCAGNPDQSDPHDANRVGASTTINRDPINVVPVPAHEPQRIQEELQQAPPPGTPLRISPLHKQKRNEALDDIKDKIWKRDLSMLSPKLGLPGTEIDDLKEEVPHDTQERARKTFLRATHLKPNLTLQDLRRHTNELGYLTDIIDEKIAELNQMEPNVV